MAPKEATSMSEANGKSWEDIVDRLQGVVNELRGAAGRPRATSPEEAAAAERLKANISRLEKSATEVRSRLGQVLETQRGEYANAFDRERAEQAAGQFRVAFDELIGLGRSVAHDLRSVAETTYTQAQPELKSAIRTVEDVASAAAAWLRAAIERERRSGERRSTGKGTPLDDL
jgi:hypothetical protein